MNQKYLLLFALLPVANGIYAQQPADSNAMSGYLNEVIITTESNRSEIGQLPEVSGANIYASKKTSVIVMDKVAGNIVTNSMRQVLAKVPGVQIWESDASGIQIGIATRGLSPNRSWEFNVRQNGYDISADPFGYPEAYFNPPLQAVQRIQIVRGAGALQYGPQFGGLLNYIIRDGSDIRKPFQFETNQTVGSYNLFGSYNAIGGSTNRLHYYAFFDHRNGDGWRENSRYQTNTGFATFNLKVNSRLTMGGEVLTYDMRSQQPGGLTDSMFRIDARQSQRARNWFSTPWTTAAVNLDYQIHKDSRLNVKLAGMWGDRNSVGFTKAITIPDSINRNMGAYAPREVAIDQYRNQSIEARYLTNYRLGRMNHTLSLGARFFNGHTDRWQKGAGTTGAEYDKNITTTLFPNDLQFTTQAYAVFAEHIFRITDRLLIIPGLRYEGIQTSVSGRLGFKPDGSDNRISDQTQTRQIVLGGIGAEYHFGPTELYANATQNYRPMLFSDLSALPTTDVIDPNLKDATGYNIDLGYRGAVRDYLYFDVSGFVLQYNNRLGSYRLTSGADSGKLFRTNVGNSISKGLEALVEFNPIKAWLRANSWGDASVFVSYGYTDASYRDHQVIANGNRVEHAPKHILRTGVTYHYKRLSATWQFSYVDEAFATADNNPKPSVDGTSGIVPSYSIHDVTIGYQFPRFVSLKAGVNNLADARYFTRRSGGYPGPGLLPAEGRTFFLTIGAKI